jgi:hypothetical protein
MYQTYTNSNAQRWIKKPAVMKDRSAEPLGRYWDMSMTSFVVLEILILRLSMYRQLDAGLQYH